MRPASTFSNIQLSNSRVIKPETAVDYAIEKPAMMQKVGLGGGM